MAASYNNTRMTVNDWKRLMNPAVDLYNRSFPKGELSIFVMHIEGNLSSRSDRVHS